MNLSLVRFAYLPEATLGWLNFGALRIATLEEAWRPDPDGPGGQRREPGRVESCIPDGLYEMSPHSGRFRDVWVLVNPQLGIFENEFDKPAEQWGRATILLHAGNSLNDTLVCILLGTRHGRVDNRAWVYESAKAVEQLRMAIGTRDTHALTIRPTRGTAE